MEKLIVAILFLPAEQCFHREIDIPGAYRKSEKKARAEFSKQAVFPE
jgi:hypothetical protein